MYQNGLPSHEIRTISLETKLPESRLDHLDNMSSSDSFDEGYNDNSMNKPKWRRICGPKVRTGCIT